MDFAGSNDLYGATVLEIGGGIGDIQLELLLRGASRTTNLELSGAYEAEAMRLLDEKGLRGRAARVVGVDLAVSPAAVEAADIVVLHRVSAATRTTTPCSPPRPGMPDARWSSVIHHGCGPREPCCGRTT